jgi:hypothetical protein
MISNTIQGSVANCAHRKVSGAKFWGKASKSLGTDRQKFGDTTTVGFCVFRYFQYKKRKIQQG